MIPPVVASDRGTAQTVRVLGSVGVVGPRRCTLILSGTGWKAGP